MPKEDEDEEMDMMDSDEDQAKESHKRHHHDRKHMNALPPRKAIKKLIYKELDIIAPQIF